jgi:hypothetical protein
VLAHAAAKSGSARQPLAAARDVTAGRRAAVRFDRRRVRERRSALPEPDCSRAVRSVAAVAQPDCQSGAAPSVPARFSAEAAAARSARHLAQRGALAAQATLPPEAAAGRGAAAAQAAVEEPQREEVAEQDAAEELRREAAAARAEAMRPGAVQDAAVPLRVAPGAQVVALPLAAVWTSHRDRLHWPAL